MKNKQLTGLLCAFFATMCWACNYPVSRLMIGGTQLDEWYLSYLRIVIAVLFMLPFTFKSTDWQLFKKNWKTDWKMFLFLGSCCIIEGVLCFVALKYTTAGRASLMANTAPVFTLLISLLFAKEKANASKITGMILGLCGIILVAYHREKIFSPRAFPRSAEICWPLYRVYSGRCSPSSAEMFQRNTAAYSVP